MQTVSPLFMNAIRYGGECLWSLEIVESLRVCPFLRVLVEQAFPQGTLWKPPFCSQTVVVRKWDSSDDSEKFVYFLYVVNRIYSLNRV